MRATRAPSISRNANFSAARVRLTSPLFFAPILSFLCRPPCPLRPSPSATPLCLFSPFCGVFTILRVEKFAFFRQVSEETAHCGAMTHCTYVRTYIYIYILALLSRESFFSFYRNYTSWIYRIEKIIYELRSKERKGCVFASALMSASKREIYLYLFTILSIKYFINE